MGTSQSSLHYFSSGKKEFAAIFKVFFFKFEEDLIFILFLI